MKTDTSDCLLLQKHSDTLHVFYAYMRVFIYISFSASSSSMNEFFLVLAVLQSQFDLTISVSSSVLYDYSA